MAYRHLADGHESLVVNHSVSVGGVSSVRWYELRNATGSTIATATPTVYQQGTLDAADGVHRWMGSIAMDQTGDIALGYSASESREAVGIVQERRRQRFQRDVATEFRVAGAVDLAHAAGAERRDDLVQPEASARLQRHC